MKQLAIWIAVLLVGGAVCGLVLFSGIELYHFIIDRYDLHANNGRAVIGFLIFMIGFAVCCMVAAACMDCRLMHGFTS